MKVVSWNIKSGGFSGYSLDAQTPERENTIKTVIENRHLIGANTVAIQDAFRWGSVYGGEAGIAAHLGYKAARFALLNDARHRDKPHAEIGVTIATDEPIAESRILDLETRCAQSVTLNVGKYGLQLANVYLEDNDEAIRLRQVRALMSQLSKDLPTLIVGDLNTLRPSLSGATALNQLGDLAVRAVAPFLPNGQYTLRSIKSINGRQVIPFIESCGFTDADPTKSPTAPSILPVFGVDYAFTNAGVRVSDFTVLRDAQIVSASDHLPITFSVGVTPV